MQPLQINHPSTSESCPDTAHGKALLLWATSGRRAHDRRMKRGAWRGTNRGSDSHELHDGQHGVCEVVGVSAWVQDVDLLILERTRTHKIHMMSHIHVLARHHSIVWRGEHSVLAFYCSCQLAKGPTRCTSLTAALFVGPPSPPAPFKLATVCMFSRSAPL
jgi:hypothetical protein